MPFFRSHLHRSFLFSVSQSNREWNKEKKLSGGSSLRCVWNTIKLIDFYRPLILIVLGFSAGGWSPVEIQPARKYLITFFNLLIQQVHLQFLIESTRRWTAPSRPLRREKTGRAEKFLIKMERKQVIHGRLRVKFFPLDTAKHGSVEIGLKHDTGADNWRMIIETFCDHKFQSVVVASTCLRFEWR